MRAESGASGSPTTPAIGGFATTAKTVQLIHLAELTVAIVWDSVFGHESFYGRVASLGYLSRFVTLILFLTVFTVMGSFSWMIPQS